MEIAHDYIFNGDNTDKDEKVEGGDILVEESG